MSLDIHSHRPLTPTSLIDELMSIFARPEAAQSYRTPCSFSHLRLAALTERDIDADTGDEQEAA